MSDIIHAVAGNDQGHPGHVMRCLVQRRGGGVRLKLATGRQDPKIPLVDAGFVEFSPVQARRLHERLGLLIGALE